ncbi:MAG: shikimate dehydrogenase [Candidatus Altiarchaeales archaeon WOR_SM1_86-2]|nr:MAG: shikimate dehydrogenase [Candidatus Altiarchaeales archaeon WOR_SM1_86-2]
MIDAKTRLLGVIGHPIRHSLSPAMHNAVFKETGLNYVYLAFDVAPENLSSVIECSRALGIAGLNVTIPHKVSVIPLLDRLSREARLIGAVNTVHFTEEGSVGYNTDGVGCVRALRESGIDVKGKSIFIVGAGGASRAISFQCALEGAELSITNRAEEMYMAADLSGDIKDMLGKDVEVVDFSIGNIKEKLDDADILIHTTPVGMYPDVDASIVPAEIIPSDIAVMDIVYNPVETKLLRDAKKRGCKVVDGVGMLTHQGAESLRIWLDIEPPIDIMGDAVEGGLMK